MVGKNLFRDKEITYDYGWLDNDTFYFQFGDGELSDENGDYFVHFEYHVKDKEWVVEIFWDDDSAKVGFEGSDEYITENEIKAVKRFINESLQIELRF